jgi:hypothetical protein
MRALTVGGTVKLPRFQGSEEVQSELARRADSGEVQPIGTSVAGIRPLGTDRVPIGARIIPQFGPPGGESARLLMLEKVA